MEEIELNSDELKSNTLSKLDGDPKTSWFCNKKGLLLKTYRWLAKNAFGAVLLLHGFQSHTRLTFMKINIKMPNKNHGLVVDTDNYYIYKDSWIEKFNQSGYSVYALDLQGHGESQAWKNIRGDFSCYDDLVDDVMQYMNHIQDEISNDNKTNYESHNIVTTKKKKLPIYVVGYSLGGNIALRILQLLNKEKRDNINAGESNNYKKCSIMLGNSTNMNEIDNGMCAINNSNDYSSDNSYPSTSSTANTIASYKDEGCYNYLDKLNIKGCVSLSGLIRVKSILDPGNKSFKYFYLPITKFLRRILPCVRFSGKSLYKYSEYDAIACKYDKFKNRNVVNFKYMAELMKATTALDCNINYMPSNIPLLFVHSNDDTVCSYEWAVSFYNRANVTDKKFHAVENMNHDTTTKPGNEEIVKEIIDWICNLRANNEDE
ncbi:lysophospholipase, putative [Plasmodium chabaudi chabaudi]|uniref:Lysophospholipase, putative n=1 Tax=Plasmodium chabaudi chabaudi TaxID=31271 RepID=A0A1C6WPN2_PLACU|nr:lysophospholipase, putative [Plasmodium chabaudi chabaudi]